MMLLLSALVCVLKVFTVMASDVALVEPKPYFLSIITLVKDEGHTILELVQHYIEEGADHVYIFDDNSEDSSLESLKCFDSKYITIYGMNDTDVLGYLGTDDRKRLVHELIYAKMYKQAAKKSDWVIMVDGDEFITSRAEPNRTIKEILQADYKHCGIVSVPWIIYSWGHQVSTPNNTVRYQLNYRWMLDEEHAVPNTQPYPFKWRNRHVEGIEAKVIVNTTSVRSLGQSLHSSTFSGPVTSGTVCVPRVDGPLSCAAEVSANHTRLQSFAAVPQSPNKNRGYYIDLHGSHEGLEQWCPYGNEILSHQSPDHLCIKESDIDKLRLATFHYQVKSKEDWERKKGKSRHFNGAYVLGKIQAVNRLDAYDDFMTAKRKPAREQHPDFIRAQKAIERCSSLYIN